jgi:NAD+ synthase
VTTPFSALDLELDPANACAEIEAVIRDQVFRQLRRRGVVVGLSGGIDSSVVVCLCARALGPEKVFVLFMPDEESAQESLELGALLVEKLGVDSAIESIAPILTAAGCYRRRDEAVRIVIPEYKQGWKSKLVAAGAGRYSFFKIIVESPEGLQKSARLTLSAYLGIVSAMNLKQRARAMLEYYHADRLNYAVAGTANRLEYDQGFFVKYGDGASDLKPIAHLYKGQVYQIAEWLGVPEEIRRRPPTTDTYSLPQSQEEFYFQVPFQVLEVCMFGKDHSIPVCDVAAATGMTPEKVQLVYENIEAKRRAAEYLHKPPLRVVAEVKL